MAKTVSFFVECYDVWWQLRGTGDNDEGVRPTMFNFVETVTSAIARPVYLARFRAFKIILAMSSLCVVATFSKVFAATTNDIGFRMRLLGDPIDHLDGAAREPMVAEHPDGTLFVAGYGERTPTLWKSRDRGVTWVRVNVGKPSDGAIGNSDVDLAVAPNGTLYFVTMVFDRAAFPEPPATRAAGQGTHISIGVSKDVGNTWRWKLLSDTPRDDRPWVEVAANGTAHVIWNDGTGVFHAVSKDDGGTWTELPRVYPKGGSSHLALGPNDEIAVRITPFSASGLTISDGVDLIVVSRDGGTTWHVHRAPGEREWTREALDAIPGFALVTHSTPPLWVEPIAWDGQGALYSLWTDREDLWLARSIDHGKTWRRWRLSKGADLRYFPYLVGRGKGELAATWFSGRRELLQAHIAHIDISGTKRTPRVFELPPFQPDTWRRGRSPGDPPVRDTAGEYLAMAFLRDGSLAVVSPIQNAPSQRLGFSFRRIGIIVP